MLTLWDLLETPDAPPDTGHEPPSVSPAAPTPKRRPLPRTTRQPTPKRPSAPDRYRALERTMLTAYRVRVRKWRTHTSGVAWQVLYRDGTISRLIEAPRPRGPVSTAVFLHEIGHHAIGFTTYKLRCLEEYHAWRFALEQMALFGIEITPRVRFRVRDALLYEIKRAARLGFRRIPPELIACIAEQEHFLGQSAFTGTSKSASINATGSNGWTSAGVSPTPTNFTGSPS